MVLIMPHKPVEEEAPQLGQPVQEHQATRRVGISGTVVVVEALRLVSAGSAHCAASNYSPASSSINISNIACTVGTRSGRVRSM